MVYGTHPDQQRVIFDGQELENMTVSDYEIHQGAEIELVDKQQQQDYDNQHLGNLC